MGRYVRSTIEECISVREAYLYDNKTIREIMLDHNISCSQTLYNMIHRANKETNTPSSKTRKVQPMYKRQTIEYIVDIS